MTDPISIGQASLNTRPHALYRIYRECGSDASVSMCEPAQTPDWGWV